MYSCTDGDRVPQISRGRGRLASQSMQTLDLMRYAMTSPSHMGLNDDDLRKANLRKVNFSGTDLRRAILFGVDLSESDLFDTDLSESDSRGATLFRAYLSRALLPKTYLS